MSLQTFLEVPVGWQPVLREDDQVLTQHRSCVGGAEHAVGLVQAAVSLKFAMTAVGIAPLAILIKTLGRSDDSAVAAADWHCPDAEQNLVARTVTNRNVRPGRLAVAQYASECCADFTHARFIFLVLRRKKDFAKMSHYVLSQIAGDPFRAFVPELDALIVADEIHPGVDAFQDGS
jgi:hypothetical protein